MKISLKTVDDVSGHALKAYQVLGDGIDLGRVEQVETTKTGFRFGRCIGQVPCKAWRAYFRGKRLEGRKDWASGSDRGFLTRAEAVEAIITAAEAAGV